MTLISIIVLGATGIIAAILLYIAAKKFHVYEDPRIAEIEQILPGANCGGCGFSGCHAFALECAGASSLAGLSCSGLSEEGMEKIASILGLHAVAAQRKVAVVRCSATCSDREPLNHYDGVESCAIQSALYQGESDCIYGCLGCGDCVKACAFDAIHINPETGLPEVDEEKCTSCGACVKACPRNIIEIRLKGKVIKEKARRVYVSCVNKDKGPVANKVCKVSCIACGKCQKVCKFDAITIENNVAYIDPEKCKACGMCVRECPKNAIQATWELPAPKPKAETAPKTEAKAAKENNAGNGVTIKKEA